VRLVDSDPADIFLAAVARKSSDETIVAPLQERLPLTRPAGRVVWFAISPHLTGMTRERPPATDLPVINIGYPTTQIVAAIPLKPSSRVGVYDPSIFPPNIERLAALDAEAVARNIGFFAKLCVSEPIRWEFISAIVAIFSLEYPQFQHFCRREVRLKRWIELTSDGTLKRITISLLHSVANMDHIAYFEHIGCPCVRLRRDVLQPETQTCQKRYDVTRRVRKTAQSVTRGCPRNAGLFTPLLLAS
jgi:hypothetical protein